MAGIERQAAGQKTSPWRLARFICAPGHDLARANYRATEMANSPAPMPGFIGQALYRHGPEFGMPKTDLCFVLTRFRQVRHEQRSIAAFYLRSGGPHFRAYSADEAYIDLTRYLRCRVACGDHASARAMLADEALESGASTGSPRLARRRRREDSSRT